MKKINKKSVKAGVAVFIVALFLLTIIPVNASVQTGLLTQQQLVLKTNSNLNEPVGDEPPLINPGSALLYIVPPLLAHKTGVPYRLVRDWSGKSFPNSTLMWIGSGISIRPRIGIQYVVISRLPDPPEIVELYSDGELYATLAGISIPPINPIFTLYPLLYKEKGFHHLKFVPDGNESACLEIDFQVGFNGFLKNILPHLIQ